MSTPFGCRSVIWGLCLVPLAVMAGSASEDDPVGLKATRKPGSVEVGRAGAEPLLTYRTEPPSPNPLPVESGGYFHPVRTPSGLAVTDLAPKDHRHHRGIFLAWVEVRGAKDADFWGWGARAPVKGRRVVTREVVDLAARPGWAGFRARNDWTADDTRVVAEELTAAAGVSGDALVLDLTYVLTPDADTTIGRSAFGGFCVRVRGDAEVAAVGPDGRVDRPEPKNSDPATGWPAARWYGYTLRFKDGKTAGVAVIDHPDNPPSLWHNLMPVRMLNPCVVAPGALAVKAGKSLTLKYRVVATDGPVPGKQIDALADEWIKPTGR